MAVAAVARALVTALQQSLLLRLETKLALLHSSRFFTHLLRLPIPYFVQRYAGDIATRVAINDSVANVIASKLAMTAIDIVVLVFYFLLMLRYGVILTLVVAAIAGLNIVIVKLVARIRTDASRHPLFQ